MTAVVASEAGSWFEYPVCADPSTAITAVRSAAYEMMYADSPAALCVVKEITCPV